MWGALAVLCALVMTACGADVNSQLELEEDFSGTRTFVMTMKESDVESLSGGIDAAAQTLEAHTPEVLSFEGIERRDEGYSATFTMAFDDLESYQDKINVLLDASEVPASDRDMNIDIADQQLVTTLSFQESFYNDDLMGWAVDALISDEVVGSDATVLTSSGNATVIFDGEEVDTSTSLPRMHFTLKSDHRFEDLGLDFEFLDPGQFQVTMNYLVSAESSKMQNDFLTAQVAQLNDLDGLVEPVADSGVVNPTGENNETRRISVQFSNPEAVSSGLQILLANEDATFEVHEAPDANSPDVVTRYIGFNWTCTVICDPNNLQQLAGETTYPEHWQLMEERRGKGEFLVEFNRDMPLQELTSATHLAFDGTMKQTFEFVVDNAAQEGHEDTVIDRFAPPPNTGSFHSAVQNSRTVYTTTFQAENAHELTALINTYFKDKGAETLARINHEPLTGIWSSYDLRVDLSPIWEVATGGVEDATTFRVELPVMHSGHTGDAATNERVIVVDESAGAFAIHANGPTITTIWVAAVTLLFLIVIVVLLLRTRRAASRVWAVATAQSDQSRPYNIQGPNDDLTETQIFDVPPASGGPAHATTQTMPRSGNETTKPLTKTGPFPEIPVPSHAQYQELQNRLRQMRANAESSESDTAPTESAEDTDSEDPTDDRSRGQ